MLVKRSFAAVGAALGLTVLLAACSGDDGSTGPAGPAGPAGADGASSLVVQTGLSAGDAVCPAGGIAVASGLDTNGNGDLDAAEISETSYVCRPFVERNFNRIASFPACLQLDSSCNTDTATAAEIAAASVDGRTLIYTDSPSEAIGFVDISDPASPSALARIPLAGEPTSVAVAGGLALVAVDTSPDFVNPSGDLYVFDIASRSLLLTMALAGQPDSVAVSPDGAYAAIVIENQRDEDLGDGRPPQLPAGTLQIIELSGDPLTWVPVSVDLTGLADLFAADPEPEYVDINENNIAVVTLQENNHLVLIDLTDGSIVNEFSAGTVDLTAIDATEEDPAIISQTEMLAGIPREPDGVTWLNAELFVTADEGDLDGGSRGFTVFNTAGDIVFTSGNFLDHEAVRVGHYPDSRSGNKGNETENADFGTFGGWDLLFLASERSSLIFVYDVSDPISPRHLQTLPAALGPEGVLAVPSRNLLIASSEEDSRADGFRGVVNIYRYETAPPAYPTIRSADRLDGTPIPWGALSGLASGGDANPSMLYSIEDSYYGSNRIFGIDISRAPAELVAEIPINDANGVFAAIPAVALADTAAADDDPSRADVFDEVDLDLLINDDGTVNIDPEGIALSSDGGFWVASEGAGTVGDAGRPVNSLNFVFKTDANGVIEEVIMLDAALNDAQLRFGFEGVTEYNGSVYVAFQRVWPGDTDARIGIYDVTAGTWSFLFYPLDAPESQNGGWVGLSDLTSLGDGRFLVVERDNQGGPDAAIKRLYLFDVTGLAADSIVTKTLIRDLLPDLAAPGGLIPEKIEGLAVTPAGDVYIVNDNDGVDDNSGETELLNLGAIL